MKSGEVNVVLTAIDFGTKREGAVVVEPTKNSPAPTPTPAETDGKTKVICEVSVNS